MIASRFVVIALLCFWLGGFTFYSGVAIPMAVEVLGSHREVGFITQRVTGWLNLAGAGTLLALLWNVKNCWTTARRYERWGLSGTLGLMIDAAIALIILHQVLDARLDPDLQLIKKGQNFSAWHRAYLMVSTAQWAAGLVHLWFVLSTWQRCDRNK